MKGMFKTKIRKKDLEFKRVCISLTPYDIERLDFIAAREGIKKNEFVKQTIRGYITQFEAGLLEQPEKNQMMLFDAGKED